MKKLFLIVFFIFYACIKSPHEVGWFLTLRIPGKLKKTTVLDEVSKSDKYKVIADSVFNIQKIIHPNLNNYSGFAELARDTLRRFIPKIIDTTRSEFGSLLFLIYGGTKYKGNVLNSPCTLKTKILAFSWNDISDTFELFKKDSVKQEVSGNFNIIHRLPFNDFPAGPHRFVIIPQILTGTANFDTVETFKEALFGARILGDNILTFTDTIKNDNKDVRDLAKENRIQKIFLHADVTHSLPARFYLSIQVFTENSDTFMPVNNLLFRASPKNIDGVSIDSTKFSFEIDIPKEVIDLAKDSLIFYKAFAIVDSQGNAYIKPLDFLKLKGYLGITVYTLER
ncbi:MAG: hypothetical protein ABIM98_06075 [candidate division WOR-3 bacterium]